MGFKIYRYINIYQTYIFLSKWVRYDIGVATWDTKPYFILLKPQVTVDKNHETLVSLPKLLVTSDFSLRAAVTGSIKVQVTVDSPKMGSIGTPKKPKRKMEMAFA